VYLDVAQLRLDGGLDHLDDEAVVERHGEDRAGDPHRHGHHHDARTPQVSPGVAPRHAEHQH
jgi:hypothetical protein